MSQERVPPESDLANQLIGWFLGATCCSARSKVPPPRGAGGAEGARLGRLLLAGGAAWPRGAGHICRACSACHVRAPRPSAATCGPGQPVPGSCPASPSAAAGLAVPPAITLQSLRRRHRRQFCSPQPWQLRARASSIRRRRHLTPRAGQRHQPLTARPNLPFPTLASSASKSSRRTSLLQRMQRQHHVRGRADWRTCMPSHAPHSPPAWIDQLTAPPAPTTACRVMKHDR